MDHLDFFPVRASEIKKETSHNPVLSRVLQFVLHGWEAKIHIEENAAPRFCQARSVPFAMKTLVEKELDNLKAQGIIEPVVFSHSACVESR